MKGGRDARRGREPKRSRAPDFLLNFLSRGSDSAILAYKVVQGGALRWFQGLEALPNGTGLGVMQELVEGSRLLAICIVVQSFKVIDM